MNLFSTIIPFLLIISTEGGMFDRGRNFDYLYRKNEFGKVPTIYDYIVVGGGSAGGMLAMRLAKKGYSTLLLEMGPEPEKESYNITVPGFSARASEDEKIALDYFVKHYKEDTNLRQNVYYPRANGLGGCSLHHAQIAVYPQTRDFELLYQLTGNEVFKEKVFRERYFKPIEGNNYPLQVSNRDAHGYMGWYPISYSPLIKMLSSDKSLSKILAYLSGDPTHDVNGYIDGKVGVDQVGIFNIPSAVHPRNYTRMNFLGQLQMARAFDGLTILTDTLVTKVLFDRNKKAIGVNVRHGPYLYRASPKFNEQSSLRSIPGQFFARHEIILSAGTFNTPQLLMLSGIGDEEELSKFNIPVISNLKGVGKNLMDRYEIPYIVDIKANLNLFEGCFFVANEYADRCFGSYLNDRAGPYLANSGISGEIYKTDKSLNEPDIFIINTPLYFYGYHKGYSEEAARNIHYFNRLILKAHSGSKGYVKLNSLDPREPLDINLMKFYEGGEEDLNSLITAVEYVRNVTRDQVGDIYDEVFPGKEIKTRAQLAKWIIDINWGHHVCCTAKLGLDNDPMAVLDSRFRVRGVKGLRVVDMSALPDIPGFFPNLFIHIMGNVVGDFIIEDRETTFPIQNYPIITPQLLKQLYPPKGKLFDPLNPSPEFYIKESSSNNNFDPVWLNTQQPPIPNSLNNPFETQSRSLLLNDDNDSSSDKKGNHFSFPFKPPFKPPFNLPEIPVPPPKISQTLQGFASRFSRNKSKEKEDS